MKLVAWVTLMANGAKFSQAGTDINKASDHEIHFTSEWPAMKVIAGGHVSATVDGSSLSGSVFYTHNLGFVPAFIPYVYDSATGTYQIFRAIMSVDKENVYWHNGGGGGGGIRNVEYGLYVFAIDIEKNFVAPKVNPNPDIAGGTGEAYGIKIAKEGLKVTSLDMQDFLVNTEGRSPLVHAVSFGLATEPSGFGTTKNFSYTHDLPFNPMFLTYIERSGFPGRYFITNNFAGTTTSGSTITLTSIDNGYRGSIVVLKNPFDVSENTIEVSL